eukprot:COSAG02_NODE_2081_length_9898_cov_45.797539_2_plen_193_part_00
MTASAVGRSARECPAERPDDFRDPCINSLVVFFKTMGTFEIDGSLILLCFPSGGWSLYVNILYFWQTSGKHQYILARVLPAKLHNFAVYGRGFRLPCSTGKLQIVGILKSEWEMPNHIFLIGSFRFGPSEIPLRNRTSHPITGVFKRRWTPAFFVCGFTVFFVPKRTSHTGQAHPLLPNCAYCARLGVSTFH